MSVICSKWEAKLRAAGSEYLSQNLTRNLWRMKYEGLRDGPWIFIYVYYSSLKGLKGDWAYFLLLYLHCKKRLEIFPLTIFTVYGTASSLDEQELHLPVWPAGQAEGGRQLRHQGLLPGDIQREGNFSISSPFKVKQTLYCYFKASSQEISDKRSFEKLKQSLFPTFKLSLFDLFDDLKQTLSCSFKDSNQDLLWNKKLLHYVLSTFTAFFRQNDTRVDSTWMVPLSLPTWYTQRRQLSATLSEVPCSMNIMVQNLVYNVH